MSDELEPKEIIDLAAGLILCTAGLLLLLTVIIYVEFLCWWIIPLVVLIGSALWLYRRRHAIFGD